MEFLAQIHSKLVHFPLAFLMLYPIIELLFLVTKNDFYNKVAFLFLSIGVIGSFFAVLSGNQAFKLVSNWQGESMAIFNSHQTFANFTVWFFTALLILRYVFFIKKKLTNVVVILLFISSLAGSYFVFQTGLYGGKLSKTAVINSTIDSGSNK